MGVSEFIALLGLILAGASGLLAGGNYLFKNSIDNAKKLTHISDALDSNGIDLAEIKGNMRELRSEQKVHAARVEAMERQVREERYNDQIRYDELKRNVRDLWELFKRAHPQLFKRSTDYDQEEDE